MYARFWKTFSQDQNSCKLLNRAAETRTYGLYGERTKGFKWPEGVLIAHRVPYCGFTTETLITRFVIRGASFTFSPFLAHSARSGRFPCYPLLGHKLILRSLLTSTKIWAHFDEKCQSYGQFMGKWMFIKTQQAQISMLCKPWTVYKR